MFSGYCEIQDIICAAENTSSQDVSVAQLIVGVYQLKNKNDSICTAEDMNRQDDLNVYGQTSGGQYVCTVCTVVSD